MLRRETSPGAIRTAPSPIKAPDINRVMTSNTGRANIVLSCMHGIIPRLLLILGTGLLFSCSGSRTMPVSPLITHSLHADSRQSCFDGVWYNPTERSVWNSPRLKVYVAPINIDYIKAQFPREAPVLAEQFRTELQKDIRRVLEHKSKQTSGRMRWQLVDRPVPGCVILDLAIVKLKPTDVGGNIMSDLVSLASPLPGTSLILGRFMSGDVGIEGRLSEMRTDTSIMEFKAYNTDPITLFSVKEFERFAFDRRNLRLFSGCISRIFKAGPVGNIPKTEEFDLDPF